MTEHSLNPLYKKRVAFDGDSICQAGTAKGGWPARIGEANSMEWYNYGIGGGTIAAESYNEGGCPRHWICRSIDRIKEEHDTLDYLILEGGTNDADFLDPDNKRLGVLDLGDYSGNYDDTTFIGGLETLFFKALKYYPTAKIGFIIAQKMGISKIGYGENYNRRKYFLKAIEVAKKWGIPYLDLWECTPLNPSLRCHYDENLTAEENERSGRLYEDGQHLNNNGFDLISGTVMHWMLTL